jgi:hypothetical protein
MSRWAAQTLEAVVAGERCADHRAAPPAPPPESEE